AAHMRAGNLRLHLRRSRPRILADAAPTIHRAFAIVRDTCGNRRTESVLPRIRARRRPPRTVQPTSGARPVLAALWRRRRSRARRGIATLPDARARMRTHDPR